MSQLLKLRDNRSLCFEKATSRGDVFLSIDKDNEGLGDQEIGNQELGLLEKYGAKGLGELANDSNGGLVFLNDTHANDTERKALSFFSFIKGADNGSFSLRTGNLMGVLRFRDKASGSSIQIEILSRFDKGEKNFFLNYLLSQVFDCALGSEMVSAQRSSLLEILLDIVFVRRLGEAAKAGLLRHYREFCNNDWDFRGSLDLPRHLRENVPLMHGIAYRKRDIDLDVPVNRMILMAALTVNHRHPGFFEDNSGAGDALRQLRMGVTEKHDLRALLAHRDCREPVTHPFFREVWEPLRQIARMILEDERWTLFAKDTVDEDEVSGIVFDGSWLWEEYVAKTLASVGFRHCVRGGARHESGLRFFKDGQARFYPDFLKDDTSGTCVLDAKYKRSNPNGGRNDVHQVLCYLFLSGAKLGGLVFPPVDEKCEGKEDRDIETYGTGGWSPLRNIASPYSKEPDLPIFWSCFSWAKPQGSDWESFQTYMKTQEDALVSNFVKPSELRRQPTERRMEE